MRFFTVRFGAVAFVLLMTIDAAGQSRARIVMSPECYLYDDYVLLELAAPRT
jgi:hypothetical protein